MVIEGLEWARAQDAADPLSRFRGRFEALEAVEGVAPIYLCGNSLGLQPRRTRELVLAELDLWARRGVEGHFEGEWPWYSYHEPLQGPMARVVGARPEEVVVMGSLTGNLHAMMASFYRPTAERFKIMIEGSAFPSDRYAVASQARLHGLDPAQVVVELQARPGEVVLREEDIEAAIEEQGERLALVMFGGVNYYTGQAFDLHRITAAAHGVGAKAGFDLAHAAGNLALSLHEDGVDFAVWCTYKYLNSGPGGVAGLFVHERHGSSPGLPRQAGWWGNDPATRFEMPSEFAPQRGAAGWQVSNAPILPMAALRASLELFDEAGVSALRARSERMTGYLVGLLDGLGGRVEIITPREASRRGCQVSIRAVSGGGRAIFESLVKGGVVCDFRSPDVIRVAPVPLYNTFEEIWRFVQLLKESASDD